MWFYCTIRCLYFIVAGLGESDFVISLSTLDFKPNKWHRRCSFNCRPRDDDGLYAQSFHTYYYIVLHALASEQLATAITQRNCIPGQSCELVMLWFSFHHGFWRKIFIWRLVYASAERGLLQSMHYQGPICHPYCFNTLLGRSRRLLRHTLQRSQFDTSSSPRCLQAWQRTGMVSM